MGKPTFAVGDWIYHEGARCAGSASPWVGCITRIEVGEQSGEVRTSCGVAYLFHPDCPVRISSLEEAALWALAR